MKELHEILTSSGTIQLLLAVIFTGVIYIGIKLIGKSSKRLPPGPRGIPFFGFFLSTLGDKPHEKLDVYSKKFGDIFSLKIWGRSYIVLNGYEALKASYVTDGANFLDRPEDFNVLGSYFENKSMPFKKGEEWRLLHKIMTSSIKFLDREMDEAGKTILENRIHESKAEMVKCILSSNSGPVDLYSFFANASMNVVGSLVCGEPLAITQPEIAKTILQDSRTLFTLLPNGDGFLNGFIGRIMSNPFTSKQKTFSEIRRRENNIMDKIIQEHLNTFNRNEIRDYVDMYLSERQKLDGKSPEADWVNLDNLSQNIFTFFVAGTDTTATTLYFCTFLMAKHPEIQKRCQDEIDALFDPDQDICFRDRKKLPYLEAVLNEIIRYSVIGPLPQPRINRVATTINGFYIPPRTHFITNLWSASRDEKIWERPNDFYPDHFYGKTISRDLASLTFSFGKRKCPGEQLARLELFLFFTSILQKFTISVPEGDVLKEDILPGFTRVLTPFKVIATPRVKN